MRSLPRVPSPQSLDPQSLQKMAKVNGNRTHRQNTMPAKELQQTATPGGAESGAVGARNDPASDPDLTEVVARWPALPQKTRDAVLRFVRRP
jgi:hypothetical protein